MPELPDNHDGLYGITVRLSSNFQPALCLASQSQVDLFPLALEALAQKSVVTPRIEKVYPLTDGLEAVAHAARPGTLKVLLRAST